MALEQERGALALHLPRGCWLQGSGPSPAETEPKAEPRAPGRAGRPSTRVQQSPPRPASALSRPHAWGHGGLGLSQGLHNQPGIHHAACSAPCWLGLGPAPLTPPPSWTQQGWDGRAASCAGTDPGLIRFRAPSCAGSVPGLIRFRAPSCAGSVPRLIWFRAPSRVGSVPRLIQFRALSHEGSIPRLIQFRAPSGAGSVPRLIQFSEPSVF